MYIRFECPNGHRIRAGLRSQGRAGRCPACNEPVVVPAWRSEPVTDSGVVRLLGEFAGQEATDDPPRKLTKDCPRCDTTLVASSRICPKCKLYLGVSESTWNWANRTLRKQSPNNSRKAS